MIMRTQSGVLNDRLSGGTLGSKQLTDLLESVPALIAYIDRDLHYRYVNSSYQKWIGLKANDILGKTVPQVQDEGTFETIKPFINKVLSGVTASFEYAVSNKTGLRHVDATYTPDVQDNKVQGYTVHINDITERKRAEHQLRDYVENATIGLHWVNADGIIIWANDAELRMVGYSRDEYIGHHISEFHAKSEIITDILKRLSCNEQLRDYESILKCKDGSTRNVLINSNVLWEDGKFVHTRCFTVDITARKQAEQALKEGEMKFRHLVSSLPVAFYACDKEGRISYYNDHAATLWGYEPVMHSDSQKFCAAYRVWMMDGTFLPPEKTPMAVALQTGKSFRDFEAVFQRPDRSKLYVRVNIDPLLDEENNPCGAINVFQDITSQKEAEIALRESEQQHKEILDLLPAAVYRTDAEGRIELFNKAAATLWGRDPEIGKDMWCGSWKIFDPDNGSPVPLDTCPMAVALKEARSVDGKEIIVERPDGVKRNIAPHPKPIFDSAGKLVGGINMLIDITEKKLAASALRESEERFRMMANLVPIIIWMTDEDGNFMYLSSQWSDFTGRTVQDGLGWNWMNFIHPGDRPFVETEWKKSISRRSPFQVKFEYRNSDGKYVTHQATGVPRVGEKSPFQGYIGILQDVAAQEQTVRSLEVAVSERTKDLTLQNNRLRESEERYHHMVNEVQDYAIILLSKDGLIENWNKGAEKIKGYHAEEAIGQSFKMFYTPEDKQNGLPDKLLAEAVKNGRALNEGWRVRRDGSRFWGSIVLTSLHNERNEVMGFSKVTRDLTEKKIYEDALKANALKLGEKNKELEKMNEELASFAYVSSHDLQEPLRKIQSFSSRILDLDEHNFSDKSRDYFKRMQQSANRMRRLIDDLLSYSRANTLERTFEKTDLNSVVEQVKGEFSDEIYAKRASILSSELPALNVIPFQFHQLLSNLLSNALKFTKTGVDPRIEIMSEIVHGSEVKTESIDPGRKYCHLWIADNGIGFDPAYNSKIFQVFQRLHIRKDYEGTGIGLAICKRIVENHNGFITAEGKVGEGSTFHMYIPA